MKTRFLVALLAMFGSARFSAAADTSVAFMDVTVVSMDTERVLPKQTVVVTGDRIVEIGAADRVKVPDGARRIDGTGKFLMPGLAEMHGHNPALGSKPEEFENVFFLFVA